MIDSQKIRSFFLLLMGMRQLSVGFIIVIYGVYFEKYTDHRFVENLLRKIVYDASVRARKIN